MKLSKAAQILTMTGCFFMVSGCLPPMPVETDLSACPVAGLREMVFYDGSPSSGGVVLAPEMRESDAAYWDFSRAEGAVHLRCVYNDGFERVQKLHRSVKSCRQKRAGDLSSIGCTARL